MVDEGSQVRKNTLLAGTPGEDMGLLGNLVHQESAATLKVFDGMTAEGKPGQGPQHATMEVKKVGNRAPTDSVDDHAYIG